MYVCYFDVFQSYHDSHSTLRPPTQTVDPDRDQFGPDSWEPSLKSKYSSFPNPGEKEKRLLLSERGDSRLVLVMFK